MDKYKSDLSKAFEAAKSPLQPYSSPASFGSPFYQGPTSFGGNSTNNRSWSHRTVSSIRASLDLSNGESSMKRNHYGIRPVDMQSSRRNHKETSLNVHLKPRNYVRTSQSSKKLMQQERKMRFKTPNNPHMESFKYQEENQPKVLPQMDYTNLLDEKDLPTKSVEITFTFPEPEPLAHLNLNREFPFPPPTPLG